MVTEYSEAQKLLTTQMSIQIKINFVNFNSEQNITQDSEKISILFTMSTIENQT